MKMKDLFSDLSPTYLVVHFWRGERSALDDFSRLKRRDPPEGLRDDSESMGSSLKLILKGALLALASLSVVAGLEISSNVARLMMMSKSATVYRLLSVCVPLKRRRGLGGRLAWSVISFVSDAGDEKNGA